MRPDPDNHRPGSPGSPELTTVVPALWFHARKQASPADSGQHHRTALRRLLALVRTGAMLLGFALVSLLLVTPSAQAKGGVGGGGGGAAATALTVGAATPPGGPAPFDITGAIQSFSALLPVNPFSGGTIVVNGISVLIPAYLVVTLPAAYKTVGQLFIESPAPYNGGQSGLALNDIPAPIAAYEATIAGNIVGGVYIAGLVSIAQQSLNTANGYIRSINYATGELCVGSTPGACAATDARVVINDPDGRYGLANGVFGDKPGGKAMLDTRFSVDSDNPTIHARSGYPMCVPRVAPPAVDPRCPMGNRPTVLGAYLPLYVMDAIPLTPPLLFTGRVGTIPPCGPLQPATACDVNEQAPLVVGDYIAYSGILASDTRGIYVAAYALEANVGIYTSPTSSVFYIYMDAPLISTGPAACPANAECQARLKTSIFVTDASRTPALYAVDENPLTGARTSRALPSTLTNTSVFGRFVFVTDKDTRVLGGAKGVTREIMARVALVADGTPVFYGTTKGVPAGSVSANGLVAGQYVSPVGEYIFPEPNVAGGVLTPYNFRCLAFLAKGWAQGGALPNIGRLTPFPEAGLPPATVNCGT